MAHVTMKDMLDAGVHFGHQTQRWNPKMKPYVFTARGGIHIIDLQKSVGLANNASDFIKKIASQGGPSNLVTATMLHEVVRAAQKNSLELLGVAVADVTSISKTMDAYGLLKSAIVNHLSDLSGMVEQWRGIPLHPENLKLAGELFAAKRIDLVVNVEAYRARFKNQGGRPPSWNWDAAKAHVKSRFPSGFTPYDGLNTEVAEVLIAWFRGLDQHPPEKSWLMENVAELINEHKRR